MHSATLALNSIWSSSSLANSPLPRGGEAGRACSGSGVVKRSASQSAPSSWETLLLRAGVRHKSWRNSSSLSASALALALTANAISITNVFPYAPFQVKFFGLTDDDRELGFYAGFFMTAYMVGNGATAIPWGKFADRYGKKLTITIGLLACTVPQLLCDQLEFADVLVINKVDRPDARIDEVQYLQGTFELNVFVQF